MEDDNEERGKTGNLGIFFFFIWELGCNMIIIIIIIIIIRSIYLGTYLPTYLLLGLLAEAYFISMNNNFRVSGLWSCFGDLRDGEGKEGIIVFIHSFLPSQSRKSSPIVDNNRAHDYRFRRSGTHLMCYYQDIYRSELPILYTTIVRGAERKNLNPIQSSAYSNYSILCATRPGFVVL
ncbi:hypothetical protein P280DRAFT_227650 [Massarina eburnea CBS 473.64]|uniref:Uncharacterized protein n=1 Tax=Massarina eburnea CBS 473.64 TaxID=1395130 RepID=A0A6A6SAF2_9PLEO|nr:hypothetical protein P280DRAFT_227650 [Massarina eburnea CBS 473.64]